MELRGIRLRIGVVVLAAVGLCLLGARGVNAADQTQTQRAPTGWILAGTTPANYRTGVDGANMHGSSRSAYLTSISESHGFGTLMQTISAAKYAGKRLRLRGSVKSENVADWAGLWMRVDKGQESVAFDNMQNRAIKGAQEWGVHDVVLDVPADATSISFGVLLTGGGEVWLSDVSLEEVGMDTPTTAMNSRASLPERPVNLGFSQ